MDIQLTRDQTRKLEGLEGQVQQIQTLINRARRAGLPVEDLEQRLAQVETMRRGLIAEFGPGSAERNRQA